MKKNLYLIISILLFLGCTTEKKETFQLPELNDVVIYQINPRVFAPENSFNAILPHLDQIKELGCNILWFMPIYPIGEEKSKNSPYSVKDYYGINPEFGTLDDFKTLIKESHKRNMGVIVDWVPNHTAWDNDWIQNRNWYTQDSLGNIVHPEGTDWTDVADLNFANPEMRLAMIDAMKFWVTQIGIDGFRCDAVDYVPYDFLKQCNDSLRAIPGKKLLMLAEGSRKDHFAAGFDLNYGWDFATQMRSVYQKGESATLLYEANAEEYKALPQGKLKLRFTTNHDESAKYSPIVEWVNERGSMSAFATILFFPDIPMIYGSQEIGYPYPINFFHYVPIDWDANPGLREEYQTLMKIYNSHTSFRKGDFTFFPDEDILLFKRYYKNETFYVAINTRNSIQTMELPDEMANNIFVNRYTKRNLSLGNSITLQAFEYLILK